jgi:hypothetical protein
MCGLVCVDARTGQVAHGAQMASRELVGKVLLGAISCGLTSVVSALMILFGREHRGVWDAVAGTIVVRADQHFATAGGPTSPRSRTVPSAPGGRAAVPPGSGGFTGSSVAVPPPPPPAAGPYSTPAPPAPSSAPPASPAATPLAPASTTMRRAEPGAAAVPGPMAPAPSVSPVPLHFEPAPAGGSAGSAIVTSDESHANARLSPIQGLRGPLTAPQPATASSPGAATPTGLSPITTVPTLPHGATNRWRLLFDDGRRVEVEGTVLFGRDPAPLPRYPGGQTIALADASMQLSKTHTAVGIDGDAIWVEDCNSTNGTAMQASDGGLHDIVGRRVLQAGERVVLGGQSFVVERAP